MLVNAKRKGPRAHYYEQQDNSQHTHRGLRLSPYRPRLSGHPAPVEPPPAPPAKPIPPVSAPIAPPVHGVVSPLSWLIDEAFRQNRTAIIQKLYPPIASKRAQTLPLVDLVKVAGLSGGEFAALADLHRAGNVLNFQLAVQTRSVRVIARVPPTFRERT